jgi:hypothetical protein
MFPEKASGNYCVSAGASHRKDITVNCLKKTKADCFYKPILYYECRCASLKQGSIKNNGDDTLTGFEPTGRDGPGGDEGRLAGNRRRACAYDPEQSD